MMRRLFSLLAADGDITDTGLFFCGMAIIGLALIIIGASK